MRVNFVVLMCVVALAGCNSGDGEDPVQSLVTFQDLDGLVFLSAGECPSGPNWEPITGYEGRLVAVDDAVAGEPSTKDASPNDLVIDLRGPCDGKGRLGVANAPTSTQDPTGGTLCNRSRKKGAHIHDQVGFRLCRVRLD